MSKQTTVTTLPECDLCRSEGRRATAAVDGRTIWGPWAYMCDDHHAQVGCGLGTGHGQLLVLR